MSSLALQPHNTLLDSWRSSADGAAYEQRQQGLPRTATDTASSSWFTGGLPTPPGTKNMHVAAKPSHAAHNYPSKYHYTTDSFSSGSRAQQYATHASRVPQPPSHTAMGSYGGIAMPADDKTAQPEIATHLQIPESVNKSKGSLAEFAAEIASLFWFETAETLEYAENLAQDVLPDRGLSPDAIPSIGFRKWVTTILSTTQVGKNVILLGLLFIYRLKQFNPGVSGKRGSEFRLLTIALMLGNKFLDDNTYTNKTWAEVSGISVTEIHIMEVEFLSNMRYDLYVSAEEWLEWKSKLGRLGSFYDKAMRMRSSTTPSPLTPTVHSSPHKLPSPPSAHKAHSYLAPVSTAYNQLPNPSLNAPQLNGSPSRAHRFASTDMPSSRKRSLDLDSEAPPTKRMQYSSPQPHMSRESFGPSYASNATARNTPSASSANAAPGFGADLPRLPVPRVPMAANGINHTQLAPINLPVSRAMANVYPPTSNAAAWNPLPPVNQPGQFSQSIPSLGDIPRIQSSSNSTHTSPNGYTQVTSALPGLSPSYFLTNRSSPYRPVRNVNTLLIPPPSAALQNQVRTIGHEQMHYQPLSKSGSERYTGPVPYNKHDLWHQSNTPLTQRYPHQY